MGFSVLHLQSCEQQFQTKIKISKFLLKKHVFNVNFLSNDSQIIATYAEVLKYTVKFNMPGKDILKVMIPNFFCPVYSSSSSI